MSSSIRGIAAFDLDGTLLRGATVCEVLAKPLGRLEEMKSFEALTQERDIAAARIQMAQWYGQTVGDLNLHLRNAQWAPGAREAIQKLQSEQVEVVIASITWKFAVRWFAEQLNVAHYLGTELLEGGEIVHVWSRDKAQFLRELISRREVPRHRVAAIGDSGGDMEMLREAGLRFYLGATAPSRSDESIHLPGADIRVVAEQILQAWAS